MRKTTEVNSAADVANLYHKDAVVTKHVKGHLGTHKVTDDTKTLSKHKEFFKMIGHRIKFQISKEYKKSFLEAAGKYMTSITEKETAISAKIQMMQDLKDQIHVKSSQIADSEQMIGNEEVLRDRERLEPTLEDVKIRKVTTKLGRIRKEHKQKIEKEKSCSIGDVDVAIAQMEEARGQHEAHKRGILKKLPSHTLSSIEKNLEILNAFKTCNDKLPESMRKTDTATLKGQMDEVKTALPVLKEDLAKLRSQLAESISELKEMDLNLGELKRTSVVTPLPEGIEELAIAEEGKVEVPPANEFTSAMLDELHKNFTEYPQMSEFMKALLDKFIVHFGKDRCQGFENKNGVCVLKFDRPMKLYLPSFAALLPPGAPKFPNGGVLELEESVKFELRDGNLKFISGMTAHVADFIKKSLSLPLQIGKRDNGVFFGIKVLKELGAVLPEDQVSKLFDGLIEMINTGKVLDPNVDADEHMKQVKKNNKNI